MTNNSKENCCNDLSTSLARAANWRRQLQAKYNDPRNERAAEKLDRLANEMSDLTDEQWSQLTPFYNWASGKFSDAVSLFGAVAILQQDVCSCIGTAHFGFTLGDMCP
jgi:predicted aminopeptidase